MTGQDVQQTRAAVLLRCADLEAHLKETTERLNAAAGQLEELVHVLLSKSASRPEYVTRPWFNDLITSQLVTDVREAERRLSEARALAAELGVELP